jgi:hypothetical protein
MINEVWRIESKDSISEPGEPAEPARDDPGTARAKMIKRKQDAWKLTPKRIDRARGRVPPAESAPATPEVGAYEPEPEPAVGAGSARENMVARILARSSAPRRSR